jgi:hypothetical protein
MTNSNVIKYLYGVSIIPIETDSSASTNDGRILTTRTQ